MSQWITDRLPTEADADCYYKVWDSKGELAWWLEIEENQPWCSTNCPGAYQSDDHKVSDDDMWYIVRNIETGWYAVYSLQRGQLCDGIPTRDDARKIVSAFAGEGI